MYGRPVGGELKGYCYFFFFLEKDSGRSSCTVSQHFLLLNYFHSCYSKTAHFPSFILDKYNKVEHRRVFF